MKDMQKDFPANDSWPFAVEAQDTLMQVPQAVPTVKPGQEDMTSLTTPASARKRNTSVVPAVKPSTEEMKMTALLQDRWRQLCLSIFFRNRTKIQSLGITSSIAGEGKSFIAMLMANLLARDVDRPITLMECNWENPTLSKRYGMQSAPGLAEWLRGECRKEEICYRIGTNLTVIPAGYAGPDAVRLLRRMQTNKLTDAFLQSDGILLFDLPPIVTTAYGSLAASLVDSLLFVVHAGATTEPMVAEAYSQLSGLPVYGVVFNQLESHLPRWMQPLS